MWIPAFGNLSADVLGSFEVVERELMRTRWPSPGSDPERTRLMQRLLSILQGGGFAITFDPAARGFEPEQDAESHYLGANLPPVRARIEIALREMGNERGGGDAARSVCPGLPDRAIEEEFDFILQSLLSMSANDAQITYLAGGLASVFAMRPYTKVSLTEAQIDRLEDGIDVLLSERFPQRREVTSILLLGLSIRAPDRGEHHHEALRAKAREDSAWQRSLDAYESAMARYQGFLESL